MKAVLCAVFCGAILPAAAASAQPDAAAPIELTVEIRNLEPGGDLFASVITEEHVQAPGTGLRSRVMRNCAPAGEVRIVFADLTPGVYAVRVFLDTNGNGELDRGLLGPKEPWALSYRAGVRRRMPPRFADISHRILTDHEMVLELQH